MAAAARHFPLQRGLEAATVEETRERIGQRVVLHHRQVGALDDNRLQQPGAHVEEVVEDGHFVAHIAAEAVRQVPAVPSERLPVPLRFGLRKLDARQLAQAAAKQGGERGGGRRR